MNIVFLTGSYYPYFSAVSKCIYNIANTLSEKYNIFVITPKKKEFDDNKLVYKNQTIYRTKSWKKNIFEKTLKSSSISDKMILTYVDKLDSIKDIDIIIPTCFPFETVIAALEYKKKNNFVKVFPVLFDGFMENDYLYKNFLSRWMRYKGNKVLEERMFKESDCIFHTTNWNVDIEKNWPQYANHCIEIEHPLVIKPEFSDSSNRNSSTTTFTYTGALDIQSRDPEPVLSFLTSSLNKTDSKIVICGRSTGDKIVNKYKDKYPSLIKKYPKISTEEAEHIRSQSDFLFSIGNTKTRYLQSKIFDYISSGKPIIHFSSGLDDIVIEVLKQYNNHCVIDLKENSFDHEKKKLFNFIQRNKNIRLSFETIETAYLTCTPRYISNLIEEKF